jgi:hypothetical protein
MTQEDFDWLWREVAREARVRQLGLYRRLLPSLRRLMDRAERAGFGLSVNRQVRKAPANAYTDQPGRIIVTYKGFCPAQLMVRTFKRSAKPDYVRLEIWTRAYSKLWSGEVKRKDGKIEEHNFILDHLMEGSNA